jgi:hypothetical protein
MIQLHAITVAAADSQEVSTDPESAIGQDVESAFAGVFWRIVRNKTTI